MDAVRAGNRFIEGLEYAGIDVGEAFYIGLHLAFNFPEYAQALYLAAGASETPEEVEEVNKLLALAVTANPIEGAE